MTNDEITLQSLLEKSSDASLLREMIGFAAQRLIELETDALCGAAHGQRSPDRMPPASSGAASPISSAHGCRNSPP
jgi:putative transposase